MFRSLGTILLGVACAWLVTSPIQATAEEVPPFGPPLGAKAEVVRSFSMKTTGALALDVVGTLGDGKTGLMGLCKPTTWANFGIEVGSAMGPEKASVTIITKGRIATGATGTFKLDKVYVDYASIKGQSLKTAHYGGPGVLVLTTHDAAPGQRRMVGTITGKGLKGDGGKVDVVASFDMDFSCGVK